MTHVPRILVLGAKGMVGQAMFNALSTAYPTTTFGTDRRDSHFIRFEVGRAEQDFRNIKKKLGRIDIVINCIGVLRLPNETEALLRDYIEVNALFPHFLAELATKQKFSLMHISTDAVFSPTAGSVDELSPPSPQDAYGMSKYLGEPLNKNTLTIRTSVIGRDIYHHRGLIEWALAQRGQSIPGFANQHWSGCTTLQLAALCQGIIAKQKFQTLRKKSAVYHFVPLQASKYELLKELREVFSDISPVKKKNGPLVTRTMTTRWLHLAPFASFYKSSLHQSIIDLMR